MSTATLTDTDIRLRDAVTHQLEWDPDVDASAIGVAAKEGVVTLTGFIDSYGGKLAAERAAKRVRGVRAVANDIAVRLRLARTDDEIARDAARALEIRFNVVPNVQLVVHSGRVTLTGTVEWLHQKIQAEKAVRHVRGVLAVLNHVNVSPRSGARDVHHRIVQALHRNADLDARHISVSIHEGVVTLRGTVMSWLERDAAERAAASAPGITRVDNQIVVTPRPLDNEVPDEIC
jgi:osmotically-inducible protein OsmY